jgi:toxin ParE1/3/4
VIVHKAVILPEADADIDAAFLYIAKDSLDAAIRFLVAVRADARNLAAMPGMGATRDFSRADLKGVKFWPVGGFRNFLIFYRPIEDGIEVLRVIHGARNIDRQFE